ncbi:DJ-1/PfpI family protein [Actinoplanes sp. NEAU-A12]|uniref:DJ-1/PfpI family protein n=1 Tax=Actinoplanes sandaracinus TaxID=3045177 RepID=A0ABT6WW64_9ACTN|nr:DJ-1/PfpI family protein [Actinoplanes sandaracinus]MDI6103988.1 DJ-1/PfpI family protein [Actinoplanes sandaracinus]
MTSTMTFGTGAVTRQADTIGGMRIRRSLAVLFAGLAAAAAVGVIHAIDAVDAVYPAARPFPLSPPGAVVTDPRPTVAVLLGPAGANAADVLAPFETLAVSGRYRVVTVAESRAPVPLTGGLDLVPDHTFATVGDVDWIVVPEMQEAGSPQLQPAVDWLRRRHAAGARILSVCAGTGLLARTGLLADRPATSNWLALYGLERQYPNVRWARGVRYVDDGRIITTAAVLSGVDGALRILERDHGVDVARQAAAAVQWPAYHPGGPASIDAAHPVLADAVALLNVGFRNPVRAGVLLTPGVGEIELASVFRTYTQLSYVARLTSVTADGQPIRSRHGLTFVPRTTVTAGYDRLLVPGHDAARTHAVDAVWKPVYVHSGAGFPFDGTLRDLAATTDAPTARWVAKTLEYRPDDVTGPAVPWSPVLLMALAMMAGGILYALARAALARLPRLRNWLRHLAEMLVAMLAGMMLLGPVWDPITHQRPTVATLVMALDMAVGMAVWMAVRGHGLRMIGEMTAVMVAPFVLLSPWIGGAALSATGHVLMLVAMVALMLVRWEHYAATPTWAFRSRRGDASPPAEPDQVEKAPGVS